MTRPHPYDKQIGEKDAQLGSKDEDRYNDKDGWYYKQGWDAANAKIEEVKDYELKNGLGSWYSDHSPHLRDASSQNTPPFSGISYSTSKQLSTRSGLSDLSHTVGNIFSVIGNILVGLFGISVLYLILSGFAGSDALRTILALAWIAAAIGIVVWNVVSL